MTVGLRRCRWKAAAAWAVLLGGGPFLLQAGCGPEGGPAAGRGPCKLAHIRPQEAAMDPWCLDQIDRVAAEGIGAGRMPGCVVLVGRRGRIVFLRAYGHRQLDPTPVAMTTDTVFDLASLTKPLATATAVMLLAEAGKVRLDAPAAEYLPEFGRNGKEAITIRQLLTHQGGLVADNALADYRDGPAKAWERICALGARPKPGTPFIYSDVGYIVLGELVRRVSGLDLAAFCRQRIYEPLGMKDTGFLPAEALRARSAPTEKRDGRWMRGEVHDPRAHLLGGVAGHAGLFGTASDLALYASMLLGAGRCGGVRIMDDATVAAMTAEQPIPGGGLRTLGWDLRSRYSTNRGDSLSPRAFGHGGFTGTVLWIDPELDLFVIFLSNRLHPGGKGEVNTLAGRICTVAGAALRLPALGAASRPPAAPRATATAPRQVLTGIDVLREDGFKALRGRRVGLITNQTGIDRGGTSTAALLMKAPGVKLVKLFSPEHGLEGNLDQGRVADANHGTTGLRIISLYGESRRPTQEMLADIDTLVFDIQDVGARFYTYISTMGLAMRAAAEHRLRFVVLDRPNPIGGLEVAGPVLDAGRESFVGFHKLPVRHGMTVGELAMLFRIELGLELDLQVVPMKGWRRADFLDETGLRWVNPSPNMRSLTAALLYPGVGLLEATNLSVGRGTETPFELIGAPWIDGRVLAAELAGSALPGLRFEPIRFTPASSKFAGQSCGGVRITITNRQALRAVRGGLEIARQLRALYRAQWKAEGVDHLLIHRKAMAALLAGRTVPEIEWTAQDDLAAFLQRRARVLLYE